MSTIVVKGLSRLSRKQLENGWLRPSGTTWHDFAQIIQEQFRAVMLEQISPTEAVDTILETYGQ